MIRQIEEGEVHKIAKFGKRFMIEGEVPGKLRRSVFTSNWAMLINSGSGVIWGAFDGERVIGALGALQYPDLNDGELVVTETFWFVDSEYRGKAGLQLFNIFEKWAVSIGAKRIIMGHLNKLLSDKLKIFYNRKGYEAFETHYVREV